MVLLTADAGVPHLGSSNHLASPGLMALCGSRPMRAGLSGSHTMGRLFFLTMAFIMCVRVCVCVCERKSVCINVCAHVCVCVNAGCARLFLLQNGLSG